jgi:ATP-dependent Clp protease ATP-binding subunit ClpA
MFERFTADARAIVVDASAHAIRLHHNWIGCEHLLMALASRDDPVGETFRESGVTAEQVEATILHHIGPGQAMFDKLDREALAAVGIDVDKVRMAVETNFGPDTLNRVTHYCHPARRRFPPWRRNNRHRRPGMTFTPMAKDCLATALKFAVKSRSGYIGTEHLAQSALSMRSSTVPNILKALDVDTEALRATIARKYRKAS